MRRTVIIAVTVIWFACCLTAMAMLWRYKNTPGPVGELQPRWPQTSQVARPPGEAVLVMFAHPMCPCSEASLAELRRLMSRFAGHLTAEVVLTHPAVTDEDWAPEPFRRQAESIPGVRVIDDVSNGEAAKFGARTSGHTVLYDGEGRLLFSGGITAARGHQGESQGFDDIVALLEHRAAPVQRAPVFGCYLAEEDGPEAR